MMDEPALFDAVGLEAASPALDRYVRPGMGRNARRTARRRAMIEDGLHPATRLPVTDSGTCGTCAHLLLKDCLALGVGQGRFWKCSLALKGGRGPDVVKSWPSCTAWVNGGAA